MKWPLLVMLSSVLGSGCSLLFDASGTDAGETGIAVDATGATFDGAPSGCTVIRADSFDTELASDYWDRDGLVVGGDDLLLMTSNTANQNSEIRGMEEYDNRGLAFTVNFNSVSSVGSTGYGDVNVFLETADMSSSVQFVVNANSIGTSVDIAPDDFDSCDECMVDASMPFGLRIFLGSSSVTFSQRTGSIWTELQKIPLQSNALPALKLRPRISTYAEGGTDVVARIDDVSLARCNP